MITRYCLCGAAMQVRSQPSTLAETFRGESSRGEKASRATTPPGKVQKPKYGDKKMVKAKNPKRGTK